MLHFRRGDVPHIERTGMMSAAPIVPTYAAVVTSAQPGRNTLSGDLRTGPYAPPVIQIGGGPGSFALMPGGAPVTPTVLPYATEVAADLPLGWWRLNELSGTSMVDSSGNGRNGTYGTALTLGVAGIAGSTAMTMGVSSSRCTIPYGAWMDPTGFSDEIWFKTTSSVTASYLFTQGITTNANHGLHYNAGNVIWRVNAGGSVGAITSPATYNDGNWHHAVGTWNGATMILYIDGASVATAAKTGTINTSANDFYIDRSVVGSYDEAAIYGTALSAARVAVHYAAGS